MTSTGALKTERLKAMIDAEPAKFSHLQLESTEFTGQVICGLYNYRQLMEMSGQTLIGAEVAVKYRIKDDGGVQPPSVRDTLKRAPHVQYPSLTRAQF